MRKIGISLQTPFLLYKCGVLRGYSFHGHVFLMHGVVVRQCLHGTVLCAVYFFMISQYRITNARIQYN